jgi:uncharacterized protein YkwD
MRTLRTTPAIGIVAALLATLLVSAPTASASQAPATERASAKTVYQRTAFKATNNKRKNHDLRTFKRNECLQRYAVRQARRMAAQRKMYHQDSGPVMRGCRLSWYGENVAYGYPTGRAVVRGWMHSPGHRANILRPQFRLMGLAARRGGDGRWYAAQVFGRKL